MPHVIVELHLVPIGTATPSVGAYVAQAEKVLQQYPQLKHQLHAMATTIEGDLDTIYQAIRQMQEAMFSAGALRVSTSLRIDDRRDKATPPSMADKIASVDRHLS